MIDRRLPITRTCVVARRLPITRTLQATSIASELLIASNQRGSNQRWACNYEMIDRRLPHSRTCGVD